MNHTYIESPLGRVLLVGDDRGLRRIGFVDSDAPERPPGDSVESATLFVEATRQLTEYFAGRRRAFDLRLHPAGTAFQRAVWDGLQRIPYGATCTYGELAIRLGRPTASRAVGAANGRNPLPVVIPCHRVVGADGSLTGYRGGVRIKEFLLRLERAEKSRLGIEREAEARIYGTGDGCVVL